MCLRTIPQFPNYAVTKDGRVWSKKYKKYLRPSTSNGYKLICIWKDNNQFVKSVHRLILETFVSPCPKGMEACHNNSIRNDNRLENLRWDTRSNNTKDSIKQGTFAKAKLTKEAVLSIRYMYSKEGYSQQQIAKLYHVGTTTINYIVNYKTWKFI